MPVTFVLGGCKHLFCQLINQSNQGFSSSFTNAHPRFLSTFAPFPLAPLLTFFFFFFFVLSWAKRPAEGPFQVQTKQGDLLRSLGATRMGGGGGGGGRSMNNTRVASTGRCSQGELS